MHIMPQIVNTGVYDAALVHKNIPSTKPRRVSMYEIELVLENGGYSYIGSGKYQIKKGCVICAKPGQIRHTDLPHKCYYIHVIIEDTELASMLNAIADFYTPAEPSKLETAFRALIAANVLPNWDQGIGTAAKFLEILSLLFKDSRISADPAVHRHGHTRVIQQALAYMDANYTRDITLADVAAHVHLSKIYFHNLFLASTGQTPHGYLLSKRISAVKFLLTTTDKPFSEIALDCGFSSQAYMTYVFKRETACTPRQYKKQLSLLWEKP